MHTFLLFFGWPFGAAWGNFVASAVVYGLVALKLRAIRRLHAEERDLHERHHAEHMAALDLGTPGGLAAVMSAVQDARTAAESAQGAAEGLAAVVRPAPRRGATEMRKTATRKAEGE